MSILVDEYEPVVDVEDDPFEGERDVQVRTDVWVTAEYEILPEILGRGRFGEVKRCRQYSTGREFAAKFILAPRPQDKKDVIHEVEVMKKLRHRRLLQVNDAFCFKNETCLILEIILGGELFDRVIDDTFILTEKACQCFVRQICEGVEYMHANNIIHLDLKPENILCLSKAGNRIKIIDFGLAREYDPRKELRVLFGTPEFMAPEVVQYDTITFATDIWSIGVISYVLLSGLSPFMGDSDGDTLTNVIKVDYSFDYDEFGEISQDAKDLISNLLQSDKRKRLTATECLAHAWLKKEGSTPPLSPTLDLSKQRLKRFVYRRKWRKAVHTIIALRRMGAQFIKVARKRSLTRMEAASHAKQKAEKNAMRRERASTSNNAATSVSEPKPKVANTGNSHTGKDAVSSAASRAKDGHVNVGARSKVKSDDKSTKNFNNDKRQGHSNEGNTVSALVKTKEAIKTDKTLPSQKNTSGNVDSKSAVRKDKPKPTATENNNATASLLKDVTNGKPRQKLAKDNFDFLNKHSPEPANKSVIFQLPTLRKIPNKTLTPVTIKKPIGSDAGKNALTNKSMPKLQEANAGKHMNSPAKDTLSDRHVEQKEKSSEKAKPKTQDNYGVKRTDLKGNHNTPAKPAEANIVDGNAAELVKSVRNADSAIKHVHDSKRENVHTDLKAAETCLARNEINRNPVKDNTHKEPRRYEKHPSADTVDHAKTEDVDDSGRSDSINRLCMQWPPPEDKPVNQWKPRIQIINKVGDVLKPDGTIDEDASGLSASAGSKSSKPISRTNTVEKSDEKTAKPTAMSPKPKVQSRSKVEEKPRGDIPNKLSSKVDIPNTLPSKFEVRPRGDIPNKLTSKVEGKPRSDQPKTLPSKVDGKSRRDVPNMLLSKFEGKPQCDQPKTLPSKTEGKQHGDTPNTISVASRLNKRPKRPNINGDGAAQDDTTQKTFAGRKALVLDRCPWSKKESNESTISATIAMFHAETSHETSVSGTTISTTNKTTTSSILRRSSLTRRERLVSDDDGVHGKAWSKAKRISRRDEANDTLYLSMNDNARRKPRRRTPSDEAGDCDAGKATSRAAASSDDVSEGGCGACDTNNGPRMRVTDAIAQWTNMAKTSNDVDYRRWRRGGSTPSAPGSPDTITDGARWPNQATSAYVER